MNSKKNFIGIIIINYNQNKYTLHCLQSIDKYVRNKLSFKVYLIDNNSEMPIDEEKINSFPFPTEYIKNNKNQGFAEGNNIGIRKALTDGCNYIALINNDTAFVDNSLFSAVKMMDDNNKIGIAGIVNYCYDNSDQIMQSGRNIILSKGKNVVVDFDINSKFPVYCDYVPGSSFIVKREVIDKIGLLDVDYFAYYEEADFCLRAKDQGYNTAFLPSSKILHKEGLSSGLSIKLYLRTRNELKFYKKNVSSVNFIFLYFKIFFKPFVKFVLLDRYKILYLKILIIAYYDFHKNNYGEGSLEYIRKLLFFQKTRSI